MNRRAVRHQRHAVLAARHQRRLGAERAGKANSGLGNFVIAARGRAGRLGQLLTIRRNESGAAIDRVVAAFRIDNHRLAEFVGGVDDGANDARSQSAFGIIG